MTCISVYTRTAVLELAFGLGMLASALDERERLFPVTACGSVWFMEQRAGCDYAAPYRAVQGNTA